MIASARDRFDPPVQRARWTTTARRARTEFLADVRARTGWDAARIDSVLWHGGLHLDRRPHGAADLPDEVGAGVLVDLHAFEREPEAVAVGLDRVLHDARDWLAADKPAWTTTQRSRASARLSLEESLRAATGIASLVAVHRLDRETSGVVLLAKTRDAAARLGRTLAGGGARRRYLAAVSPAPGRDAWDVHGFIGRVLDPRRYRFALRDDPAPGFRASHTRFARLSVHAGGSLVACEPTTGRTHQIRVHLAASGAPIAGDAVYGGIAGERTLLHAAELRIDDGDGERVLRAPTPPDLAHALEHAA